MVSRRALACLQINAQSAFPAGEPTMTEKCFGERQQAGTVAPHDDDQN
jgi:hypothetical protein